MRKVGPYDHTAVNSKDVYSCELLGWYTSPTDGDKVYSHELATANRTYYAKWKWTFMHSANTAIGGEDDGTPKTFFGVIPGKSKLLLRAEHLKIQCTKLAHSYSFAIIPCYSDCRLSNNGQTYYYGSSDNNTDNTSVTDMVITAPYATCSGVKVEAARLSQYGNSH